MSSDVVTASHTDANGGEQGRGSASSAPVLLDDSEWNSLGALMHLSHEIRTPLNSMLVLSQLLREGAVGTLNPEQQKYVEVIERSGHNLIRLVSDVVDLSRMQGGRLELDPQSIDLNDQLRAIISELAPLARLKHIELVAMSEDRLPRVRCDPDRVRQVLTNLIGNAIKFTSIGQVIVSAEVFPEVIAVHVSDTGVGIDEDRRDTLFEESFRTSGASGGRRGGAGLGLAIARRLVRMMGGELSFQTTPGVGSRFTFTLPITESLPDSGSAACTGL